MDTEVSITGSSIDGMENDSFGSETDVEVGVSYEPRSTMFDVIGAEKYQKKNKQGKLVDGVGLRWVEVNTDRFNYHEKTRNQKFIPFTADDVEVPCAEERKNGEPWVLKNGPEKLILMQRSIEENNKTLRRNRDLFSGKIRKNSTYTGRDATSSFKFESKRGELAQTPKFKQKRTGF